MNFPVPHALRRAAALVMAASAITLAAPPIGTSQAQSAVGDAALALELASTSPTVQQELMWPVTAPAGQRYSVSGSIVGACRSVNGIPCRRAHAGYDIGGYREIDNGKPIVAAADGFVIVAKSATGVIDDPDVNTVLIAHGNGLGRSTSTTRTSWSQLASSFVAETPSQRSAAAVRPIPICTSKCTRSTVGTKATVDGPSGTTRTRTR